MVHAHVHVCVCLCVSLCVNAEDHGGQKGQIPLELELRVFVNCLM